MQSAPIFGRGGRRRSLQAILDLLCEAEAFGHPSLLSGLGPTFQARAQEDTLCYQVRLRDAQATAKRERAPPSSCSAAVGHPSYWMWGVRL
jgi:signal-transduction protein with cAMP-binding, CBS, and nucleotidyltransferase domain